jgi:hypothetical protein
MKGMVLNDLNFISDLINATTMTAYRAITKKSWKKLI